MTFGLQYGLWILPYGLQILKLKCFCLAVYGHWKMDFYCQLWHMDCCSWFLENGLWSQPCGFINMYCALCHMDCAFCLWHMDSVIWVVDSAIWIMDFGVNYFWLAIYGHWKMDSSWLWHMDCCYWFFENGLWSQPCGFCNMDWIFCNMECGFCHMDYRFWSLTLFSRGSNLSTPNECPSISHQIVKSSLKQSYH